MDLKVYERTRYQNIYRHKKNKNYVIQISKPVKTSISRIDNKKILSTDDALKIRDNYILKYQKGLENEYKEDLDTLWDKYIYDCKFTKKLAYNSLLRKTKTYDKYLRNRIQKKVSKITTDFWIHYIDSLKTSDKQKNEVIRQLKCLFNWAYDNEIITYNSMTKIKKYKVINKEMDVWTKKDVLTFISVINEDINSNNKTKMKNAYTIKLITYIGFCTGLRIGEIRALTFKSFNFDRKTLFVNHSINYDAKSDIVLIPTKTTKSTRELIINDNLINLIKEYKEFLNITLELDISDNSLLFFNPQNDKPYNDATLRKHFNNYIRKSNVKKIRMYDLRHSYATNLLLYDVPLNYVSRELGHSSIKITGDVYSHMIEDKRKEIANLTNDLF